MLLNNLNYQNHPLSPTASILYAVQEKRPNHLVCRNGDGQVILHAVTPVKYLQTQYVLDFGRLLCPCNEQSNSKMS
jgi:hypothetical protein